MRRALLLVLFAMTACGVKGSPRPPRTDAVHEAPAAEPVDAGCSSCGADGDAGTP